MTSPREPHHRMRTLAKARDAARKVGVRWTAGLLPAEARARLMAAAQIKDARERTEAVDAALSHIQLHYPQFFLQEQ